jgi:hypothetical protein
MREVTRVVCGRVLCPRNAGLGNGSGISMGFSRGMWAAPHRDEMDGRSGSKTKAAD